MPTNRVFNIGGLNLYTNPLLRQPGQLLKAVNVQSDPYGAKTKRVGYGTFLGTANGSAIKDLFKWEKNDGSFFLYRKSGARLYYSISGTGDWTVAGNGTVDASAHVGYAVLGDTLVVGDGVGSTRHSTDGSTFTNTTLAPISNSLVEYQNAIYAAGTSSTLFKSTDGDATNWATTGTANSTSFDIPGAGKLTKIHKVNDYLVAHKSSGLSFTWDGYSLRDLSTDRGPSSPYSVGETEGYKFWINRMGHYGFGGDSPQLLSNAVQPFFYSNNGSAIAGTAFDTIPATCHRFDYFAAIGTVTDNLTNESISNAWLKYDFQKNEYLTWKTTNFPTSMLSYKDASGDTKLIFGNAVGQCYKFDEATYTDSGSSIDSEMIFVDDFGVPDLDKEWRWITLMFNPGCKASVAVCATDTFAKEAKTWIPLGDASTGVLQVRLPAEAARSKLLFVQIYEASKDPGFTFYGYTIDAEIVQLP